MVHDKKLLRLIRVIPTVLITVFALLAIFIVVNHNKAQLSSDIYTLEQDFINSEKESIKTQVKQITQQIIYEKDSTVETLKTTINNQIQQAHAIATTIYNNNKNKPEAEVRKLITDALRSIRFNDGRGYFFIYSTAGTSIMHPILPHMEGSSKANLQDIRGNYIVRDLAQLAKKHGEAFYHWWFVKPDDKTKEYEKIGFGKYFAPYDWFIGTGDYIVDVESDIKQRLIKRIRNIRFGENGYIFLLDYQGKILAHYSKELLGKNVDRIANAKGAETLQRIIKAAQQGESYIRYTSPLMPSTGKPAEKLSFVVGLADWQWVIGTGFYISETQEYLAKRSKLIEEHHKQELYTLLGLSSVVTLFIIILSLLLTKYLARRFTLYEDKINADFTELNNIRVESQYQALHDSLTKLPNRVMLNEQIKQGIALSEKSNLQLALMFVDLDDFKKINDLHGHSVGDSLLAVLGEKFPKILSQHDSVARFGGDEFIFCFPLIESDKVAKEKVKAIQALFKQEFVIQGKSIYSTCSVGVAMYPNDGIVAEDLISKADIVLYKSKSLQKGRSLFFNQQIDKQVKRDFLIESELRLALIEQELSLNYQPQICVKTSEIASVEALVRWNNKALGPVSPDEFIQTAEDIGMIFEIGCFVIEQAISDIKQFNINSTSEIQLSINISPKQLIEPEFLPHLSKTITSLDFNASLITLEITENILISDLNKIQPILTGLRTLGIKLSLDDFGTGYSSLRYLGNLPLNEIKIDRSFIDKVLVNNQTESLVKTIIAIGQFYDLTTVAEGVETKEQFDLLRSYQCDLIQGYYFDKPIPVAALNDKYIN